MRKTMLPILCLVLLLSLWGCKKESGSGAAQSPITTPTEPTVPAPESYQDAALAMDELQNLELRATLSMVTTTGETTSSQELVYEIIYTDLGTEDFQASVTYSGNSGDFKRNATEQYRKGMIYLDDSRISKKGFCSPMTEDAFLARYAPVVLMDEALYESVEVSTENAYAGYKSIYTFQSPTGPEAWLGEDVELICAEGTATVRRGRILNSTYTASYTQSGSSVELAVTTELVSDEPEPLLTTPSPADYQEIESLEALQMLHQTYDWIEKTQERTVDMTQSILMSDSSAEEISVFADRYICNTYGIDSSYMATYQEEMTYYDEDGNVVKSSYSELIQDGKVYFTYETGTSATYDDLWVTGASRHMLDWITGGFIDPDHIAAISLEDAGDHWLIHIVGDETAIDSMENNLLAMLKETAQSTEDSEESLEDLVPADFIDVTATMTLDKDTLSPVSYVLDYDFTMNLSSNAFGITKIIDGNDAGIDIDIPMTFRLEMTMEIPGVNAYQNILDAAAALEE